MYYVPHTAKWVVLSELYWKSVHIHIRKSKVPMVRACLMRSCIMLTYSKVNSSIRIILKFCTYLYRGVKSFHSQGLPDIMYHAPHAAKWMFLSEFCTYLYKEGKSSHGQGLPDEVMYHAPTYSKMNGSIRIVLKFCTYPYKEAKSSHSQGFPDEVMYHAPTYNKMNGSIRILYLSI